jgi:hypothetical protein
VFFSYFNYVLRFVESCTAKKLFPASLTVPSQQSSAKDLPSWSSPEGPQLTPASIFPSMEGGCMRGGKEGEDSSTASGSKPNYGMTATPSTAGRPAPPLAQLPTASWNFTRSNWRIAAGSELSSKCMAVLSSRSSPAS